MSVRFTVCERENVIQQSGTGRLAASPWQHVSDESLGMSGGYSNERDLNI